MVVFNLSVLDQEQLFWKHLVQKIKVVSLRWNLVPRLIRLCRNQWWCSDLFLVNFVQQIKIVSLNSNLVLRLIRICKIQWWCLLALFFAKNPFLPSLRPYGSRDFDIGSCRQNGFFKFLLQWVRPEIVIGSSLKNFWIF